jgi:hypothetical protein
MNKLLTFFAVITITVIPGYGIDSPQFKYGFGGGVNFSNILEKNSYSLFEDVSGEKYSSEYSMLFLNLGSQFFFHGEFVFNKFILAAKPGAYTFNFGKTDEIVFNTETVKQESNYLLRYLNMPVEAKWIMGSGDFKPYIGGEVSIGYLMRQGGSANNSFIKPRIAGGPVIGSYYSFSNFDLVASFGYDLGFHIITSKDNRYNTSIETPYSQSDLTLNSLHFSLSVLFSFKESSLKKSLECIYQKKRR